jgi:hypothetical protein
MQVTIQPIQFISRIVAVIVVALSLILALADTQAQAQGMQGKPGSAQGANPPGPPPQIDPEILRRLQPPRIDPIPYSPRLYGNQASKTHEWVWPTWVCWQSALGLFVVCFLIGWLYGLSEP